VTCKKDEPKPVAHTDKPPTAGPKAPVRERPWYQGEWSGAYTAKPFRVEMSAKDGAVKEWGEDDGQAFAGQGQLRLLVDQSGNVTGKATGPLGSLVANGEVDGETLRVGLRPDQAITADQIGSGTLLLNRKGDQLEGKLRASTGNSLKLRVASLTLTKSGPGSSSPPPSVAE